jgi:hypothetical protein
VARVFAITELISHWLFSIVANDTDIHLFHFAHGEKCREAGMHALEPVMKFMRVV